MAVRKPLYNNAGNLQEMSSVMITEIKNVFKYQFQAGNLVALSVVASGGNIGTIADTRLQAGAYSTNVTSTPNEGVKNIETTPSLGVAGGFYMEIALNDKWYIKPTCFYSTHPVNHTDTLHL